MSKQNKFVRTIKKIAKAIVLSNTLYFGTLMGTQYVAGCNSTQIKTQSQLEVLLEREKKKFGLEKKNISAKLISKNKGEVTLEDNFYEIILGRRGANLNTLKHELCHIYNGDFVDIHKLTYFQKGLKYIYWSEPRATICSLIK